MNNDFDPGQHQSDSQDGVARVEPSSQQTIYQLISEQSDRYQHLDDRTVARRVLAEIPRRRLDVLLPLIEHHVATQRRQNARAAEDAAFAKDEADRARRRREGIERRQLHIEDDARRPSPDVFTQVLDVMFTVGGVRVSWGDATVEQHEGRASELHSHAMGTMRTRQRHLRAVGVLRAADCKTLRELPGVA